MNEGNEQETNVMPDQTSSQGVSATSDVAGHSEVEMVFVLILVGLLGVAVFLGFAFFMDEDRAPSTLPIEENTFQRGTIAVPVDYVTRDPDEIRVLGLVEDESVGRFFTQPGSNKTLYTFSGECVGGCLQNWTPYTGTEVWEDGDFGTIVRGDTGENQYTWLGKGLYTFNDDRAPGDFLGDGFEEGWTVARP